jgi:hypothetical protein
MSDIFPIFALDWVHDKVEDRDGRVAAWVVTATLALAVIFGAVWFLISIWP